MRLNCNSSFLLFFVAFGLWVTGAQCQSFSSGLTGGFAATQVHGDGITGFNKAGLLGGFFVRFKRTDHFSLRTELNYVGKGSRNPGNVNTGAFDKRGYTFHYVELPVMAEYHLDRFYLQGGLYGAVLLWGQEMFAGEHFEVINPPLRPFDTGFVGGVGMEVTDHLEVFARYSQSLIPIRRSPDEAGVTRFWDMGFMNIAVLIGVAYSFD